MEVTIDLCEIFDEKDIERLEILFSSHNPSEFENKMQKIILSALFEYKEMLLGRGIPSRADDIQQYRLVGLIKHYFGDALPSEEDVSSMFQLTPSKSKTLIRNVRTRFRYDLEDKISNTTKSLLESVTPHETSDFTVVIKSDYALEELKRNIAYHAPENETLTKFSGGARVYIIKGDTCRILCDEMGVDFENLESRRNI